jgi:transcriptional regulator with XRE-family HTH domain
MLTAIQIRAARAGLGWSAKELAQRAGVSMKTIVRLETVEGVPQSRSNTLLEIQAALEAGGVEFVGSPNNRPGIRFASWAKSRS